ncbi:hypothetical protein GCM10011309_23330 [Litorimonas cladophorae]|uniref:Outer membrane protein beta-barrel domain-containing protein n=1 Tax=Litorimonas cladophorae TaxID=1220491 RepID=A0A918KQA5_9PROT|nr:outer membrane beta-barrel protein [Litorimonas cladophorae]GGX72338.1 hypothetical protein GCM10011309_23330 [Litorimonas cladophorae]
MLMFRHTFLNKALITGILVSVPGLAFAQTTDTSKDRGADKTGAYVSLAIEAIELNSFAGDSFSLFGEATTAAAIRGGVVVHRYFAVEGEAAIGVDNASDDGIADYESRFAGYGRARLPFGDTGFEIFARAGYAVTNIDSRNVIGGDGDGLNGISYGGGLAFNFGNADQFQLRMDYTEYNFGNDQDADALAFSVGYNF